MITNPKAGVGERIYAIGDIHGRLDLFETLIGKIREDNAERPTRLTKIVLVGDFIDRGPQSADLVELIRRLSTQSERLIVLKGNHEQAMVDAMRGNLKALKKWLEVGGEATLLSWGVPSGALAEPFMTVLRIARSSVSSAVVRWLDQLPLAHLSGDYLFVHAGIRPGVDLEMQRPEDLLWIRDEFIESDVTHPAVIVHGHSIVKGEPQFLANRIPIDTGAYESGILLAVGFEDDQRWVLAT